MTPEPPDGTPSPLLADHTTLRVGGPAAHLVTATTEADLIDAVTTADRAGEPVLILGGGSNVLVADAGFPGTAVLVATRGISVDQSACAGAYVTVAAGEVFQWVNSAQNLTGTVVTADVPVAVFAGNVCSDVQPTVCDHLVEQMTPTETWGRSYVTVPLAVQPEDLYRVVADADGTTVQAKGATVNLTRTLNAGEYWDFTAGEPLAITASAPVAVAQFWMGPRAGGGLLGDPLQVMVPPQEQGFTSGIFATAPSGFDNHYVNITAPTAATASVLLDGAAVTTEWTAIPGTRFSVTTVTLDAAVTAHTISADEPIQTVVYGYGRFTSYGYPGGGHLAPIATVTAVSLDPASVSGTVGDELCATLSVTDGDGQPVPSVNVDITLTGVATWSATLTTGANGQHRICRTSLTAGTATLKAAHGTLTDSATLTWADRTPSASTSASASATPVGAGATTSTRRPWASHVLAVAGPMAATTVTAWGLPAMPTRLRTVELDEKTTASNWPCLIASRVSAGGGAARTVR